MFGTLLYGVENCVTFGGGGVFFFKIVWRCPLIKFRLCYKKNCVFFFCIMTVSGVKIMSINLKIAGNICVGTQRLHFGLNLLQHLFMSSVS